MGLYGDWGKSEMEQNQEGYTPEKTKSKNSDSQKKKKK